MTMEMVLALLTHAYLDVPGTTITQEEKIGRNAPCPCGCGNKRKNCAKKGV